MTAFLQIDPWALLEERKQKTLATLATLADPHLENESLDQREKVRGTPAKVAKPAKVVDPFPFAAVLDALEARCPDYVEPARWHLCIEDAQRFLAEWGAQAEALGWTAAELFGLHEPPANPHPSYHRLSRYAEAGLIWHLTSNRVVALSADDAAIQSRTTGNILIYRKARKPAFGPLGDSLDDFTA